jgi:signal transduction histidine kinase
MLCEQRRIEVSGSTAKERGAILVVADGTTLMELCCMLQGAPLGPGWERPPRDGGLELEVQGEPMRLFAARSGAEAVDRARQIERSGRRLAVAFVATRLPDDPGVETISRLRAIDPCVLFVAVSSHLDREEVMELGSFFSRAADDWDLMSRPFSGELVRQKAQHMVASWNRRRSHETETARQEHEIQVARRELAAGVAHEINNPIAFVQSNLYSLAQQSHRLRPEQPLLSRPIREEDRELCPRDQVWRVDLRPYRGSRGPCVLRATPEAPGGAEAGPRAR